jgi:hypothetical protein
MRCLDGGPARPCVPMLAMPLSGTASTRVEMSLVRKSICAIRVWRLGDRTRLEALPGGRWRGRDGLIAAVSVVIRAAALSPDRTTPGRGGDHPSCRFGMGGAG